MKNSRERDQSIERLLRQSALAASAAAVTESCLEPETFAAWADGGLSGPSLELVLSHVADCSRCQALIGALARTATAVPVADPARVAPGWLRWLVPLTAAAAAVTAVALWITVPRGSDVGRRASEAPAPASAPRVAGAKDDGSAVAQMPEARGTSEPKLDQGSTTAGIADGSPGRDEKEAAKAELATTNQPGAQASNQGNAAPAEAQGRAPRPPPADRDAAVLPPAATAAAARAAGTMVDQSPTGKSIAGRADFAGVEIRSPDPAVRWRIAGSVVQRSVNGGSTWRTVSTGFQGQLTAGSAPSPSVCWLVGGATVLLSADGGDSWRRVVSPERTNLSAIRASDTRTASVTATDGRTFTTSDGGLTWVRAAPQDF